MSDCVGLRPNTSRKTPSICGKNKQTACSGGPRRGSPILREEAVAGLSANYKCPNAAQIRRFYLACKRRQRFRSSFRALAGRHGTRQRSGQWLCRAYAMGEAIAAQHKYPRTGGFSGCPLGDPLNLSRMSFNRPDNVLNRRHLSSLVAYGREFVSF